MSALELDDIQGNILRGYNFGHARHLFARVREPAAARGWLASLADPVTTAQEWDAKPETALNVALSFAGLLALDLPRALLDSFPPEFREGMAKRAGMLGDSGDGAPERWESHLRANQVHALLTVAAGDAGAVDHEVQTWKGELAAPGSGMELVHEQPAAQLGGSREHFGFTDGFAQPAVAGAARETVRGQGVPERWWPWQRETPERPRSRTDSRLAWRALRPGEFVLGYDDEDGSPPPAPLAPFDRNGTFMVWRKLAQDVTGFWDMVGARAAELGVDEQWIAACLVGRWRDGSPLVLRPEAPDSALGDDRERVNDFAYGRDREGSCCPRGAHVRRVNPRDALGHAGRLTARHRIIRRGMPYGTPDDDERGLIFVSLQASIARQFEIVQSHWCNDGDAFGLGHEPDPIAGDRPTQLMIEGSPPRFVTGLRSFVTTRGGEYLFVPGVKSLKALADLA